MMKIKRQGLINSHIRLKKRNLLYISKETNHKNLKILTSVSVIYELKVWKRDVNQA